MSTLTLMPNAAGDVCNTSAVYRTYPCPDHYKEVEIPHGYVGYNWPYPQQNTTTDAYNIEDHTTEVGIISNVRVYARLADNAPNPTDRKAASSIGVRISETTYYPATDSPFKVTNDYVDYYKDWAINPATGVAWTFDDIDALQITIGLCNPWRPAAEWSDKYCYVSYMWVEVTYEAISTPTVTTDPATDMR